MATLHLTTPIGCVTLREEKGLLAEIRIEAWNAAAPADEPAGSSLLERSAEAILAYLAGQRVTFDLPLVAAASSFQSRMRAEMCAIPYGATRSYGDLAAALSASPRAIGQACGRNPLPIVVPCHRVVAAGGRLGGYSAGAGGETKRFLLDLEAGTRLLPADSRQ